MISLSKAKELAEKYRVIPLVESLFSGTETPLSIFEKLAANKSGSFLLESAEQGVWSRYSFIGVSNLGFLTANSGLTNWSSEAGASPFPDGRLEIKHLGALDALNVMQQAWNSEVSAELPPLVSGMVGLMGWDTIQQIEKLAKPKTKEFPVPELAMAVLQDLVVVDHLESSLKLISNMYLHDGKNVETEYEAARQRIAQMKNGLLQQSTPFLAEIDFESKLEFSRRTSDSEFLQVIDTAKKHVIAGDVFQVVLSQRFEIDVLASSLDVYRVLRALNPSPYMYLLNFEDDHGEFAVIGSSPEALVRVSNNRAVLHPIAGSRPRGANLESDAALADELLSDAKEKAEHLMLVDLARNDLLKVCVPKTVSVTDFMSVERYSHIMHLVSTVEGDLVEGKTAIDVVRATFPAGTLSGAPKPMALEIIEALEPANRGLFGGVVGYFDFAGNADLAIAIRTALIRDGRAYVQAGAGIVLDSDPDSENAETLAKASAPLRAIAAANSLRRLAN